MYRLPLAAYATLTPDSCKQPIPSIRRSLGDRPKPLPLIPLALTPRCGRVGVWLDALEDWDALEDLVTEAYREVAPKRLLADLDARCG